MKKPYEELLKLVLSAYEAQLATITNPEQVKMLTQYERGLIANLEKSIGYLKSL